MKIFPEILLACWYESQSDISKRSKSIIHSFHMNFLRHKIHDFLELLLAKYLLCGGGAFLISIRFLDLVQICPDRLFRLLKQLLPQNKNIKFEERQGRFCHPYPLPPVEPPPRVSYVNKDQEGFAGKQMHISAN